jgi:Domain of Unknown Function (DUF1206)
VHSNGRADHILVTDETKDAVGRAVHTTIQAAERAVRQPVVGKLAKLGFYTKGTLFIIIGSLAVMMAKGISGGEAADARGALSFIAQQPYGKIALVVFVIGALGHGIWNVLRGVADIDNSGDGWQAIIMRCSAVGIGLFYLGLSYSALEIVLAARVEASNSQTEETLVAFLVSIPVLGIIIVSLIGIGIAGAGIHECYSGLSGGFRNNYRLWEVTKLHHGFIIAMGVLSFTARAVLLVLMGYFFIRAAFWGLSNGSLGMDASMLALLGSSYGRILVFAAGIGLVAHGILAFYEARFRRIS